MSIQQFQRLRTVLLSTSRSLRARRRVYREVALGSLAILFLISTAIGQTSRIEIRVVSDHVGRVVVQGNCQPATQWSFRDSYAGVMNLGSRVEGLKLFDSADKEIVYRTIAPGQFQAATPAKRFLYELRLAPPTRSTDAARVSWVSTDRGLLMLRDLLPEWTAGATEQNVARATVRLVLPAGWIAHTNETLNAEGEYQVADTDLAVFAVGSHLRISKANGSGMTLSLVLAGDWSFTDADALDLAGKVLKAHRDVFGSMPARQSTLILFPFPQSLTPDRWSAETRGSTVTLLMGNLPSKVAALAQLSVPLTHELLHFWVPNGLALAGDYDWFYEGFTVYEAARIGVQLGLLTFQEFLNAISRAYEGYSLAIDHDRWSLVEASRRRWTIGESSVYSKSMLIAFLYDLKVRSLSHNRHSLDDVYRSLFRQYSVGASNMKSRPGQGIDGSEAVLKTLGALAGMQDFGPAFISSPSAINLPQQLAPFGLRVETFGLRTRISVTESLSRQQRDLLHDLGYNDYVRRDGRKPS